MGKDKNKNKKIKTKKGKSLISGVTSYISKKPVLFSLLGAAGVGLAIRSSLGKKSSSSTTSEE